MRLSVLATKDGLRVDDARVSFDPHDESPLTDSKVGTALDQLHEKRSDGQDL